MIIFLFLCENNQSTVNKDENYVKKSSYKYFFTWGANALDNAFTKVRILKLFNNKYNIF